MIEKFLESHIIIVKKTECCNNCFSPNDIVCTGDFGEIAIFLKDDLDITEQI